MNTRYYFLKEGDFPYNMTNMSSNLMEKYVRQRERLPAEVRKNVVGATRGIGDDFIFQIRPTPKEEGER